MAHEVGHILLLADGRIDPTKEEDHEPLTDLLTVFLGMGVITANAVLRETYYSTGAVSSWNMSRRGYLSMAVYGYAHALFARWRGERDPDWARALRPDVRDAFDKAMVYLDQNDASTPSSRELNDDRKHGPVSLNLVAADSSEEDQGEEVADGTTVCASCGALIATREASGRPTFCLKCQDSINENLEDLEDDHQKALVIKQRTKLLWGIVLGALALVILLVLILDRK